MREERIGETTKIPHPLFKHFKFLPYPFPLPACVWDNDSEESAVWVSARHFRKQSGEFARTLTSQFTPKKELFYLSEVTHDRGETF